VAQVAGVRAARTHVRLPNWVVIDVEEQVPLVAWQVGNDTFWIGKDGRVMPAGGPPPPIHLTDSAGEAAQPKSKPGAPELRPAVLASLLLIQAERPELNDLYYGAEEGLYFRAEQGWTVYLGSEGDPLVKLERLQALQQQIAADSNKPRVVDLRPERSAFYR
jgi:cell division septal protein FtsQ